MATISIKRRSAASPPTAGGDASRERVQVGVIPRDALFLGGVGLASAALVALFLLTEHRIVGVLGMPLDDAWIHFRIAENLATGQGFAFNPGEPTSASTSPLWTVLLAGLYALTGQFIVPTLVLAVACYVATNVAVYFLAVALGAQRWLALLGAVLAAVTGRWLWGALSGMETTLFTALTIWGLLLLYAPRPTAQAAPRLGGATLLALAGLVRPEGFLLGGIALGEALLALAASTRRAGGSDRSATSAWAGVIVLGSTLLVAAGVRVVYTLGTGGGLLGNTFTAQSLPQGAGGYTGPRLIPDLWYWRSAIDSLRMDDFVLGLLIPVGIVQWLRIATRDPSARKLAVVGVLWFLALPLFNAFISPNLRHHERYLMPLIPLAVLFGVFGLQLLGELWGERDRLPGVGRLLSVQGVVVVLAMVCLADALLDARRWAQQYAGDVQSIQAINVELGKWLRTETPPDAYVAMNDIGAIAFISQRRVLDTVGIAEPGILPVLKERGRDGVLAYLQARRPDYLVIWPEWYPEIVARTDLFTPVYAVRMDNPLTTTRGSMLGGREMVVYRTHWP